MSPSPSLQIVVVEDNDSLREATVDFLNSHGHQAIGLVSAEELDDTAIPQVPELYLIDVNLPGEDGFSLAERIRRTQPVAGIVVMTARSQLSDRLEGYSCGADNYLIKPVEPSELLACVQNLARRLKPDWTKQTEEGLLLNCQTLCLQGPGGKTALTHGESILLAGFIRAAGQKLERWQAMQLIDPQDKGLVTANLEMRITALRRKLHTCGATEEPIRTLRGYGYALTCTIRLIQPV